MSLKHQKIVLWFYYNIIIVIILICISIQFNINNRFIEDVDIIIIFVYKSLKFKTFESTLFA